MASSAEGQSFSTCGRRIAAPAGHPCQCSGNLLSLFTARHADWTGLSDFFRDIFIPYLVGGIAPGIAFGMICYYISLPIVGAYQKLRERKRRERIEKAMEKRQKAAEKERRRTERTADPQTEDQT